MSKIIGVGSYLPKNLITNKTLANSMPDVDPDWIYSRTGIKQRFFADKDEYTFHMSTHAANAAIRDAKINPNDIDLIIVATTTADNSFPSVATKLHHALGINRQIPSFDLQAVCAGFIYALEVAQNFLNSNKYDNILVIGADKMSSLLDMSQRNCATLFGDGAGAIVLQKTENNNSGILSSNIHSDGSLADILYTDGGISMNSRSGFIQMNGREVFRHAIEKMSGSLIEAVKDARLSLDDVDYLIPHQANVRIIDAISERLNFPDSKVIKTIGEHANCSAASIPLALDVLLKTNQVKDGMIIAMTALGAGLVWGSVIWKW